MRLIDRYVFRELFVPFLIGTVAVVIMFLANVLIAYSGELFRKDIPFSAVGQYLLFKVPQTLNLTLPIGITMAAALAISRLARESELTAIRASGVPVRRVLAPVLVAGLMVAGFSFWLGEKVTPEAESRALTTLRKIFASPEAIGLQSNVLLRLGTSGEYLVAVGAVRRGENGEVLMNDIFVNHKPKRGEDWAIQAESGVYRDGILTLFEPHVGQFVGDRRVFFRPETYEISQRVALDDFFGTPLPDQMTAAQLRETIDTWRSRGQDTREYEVDYHNKFAVPAACLIFAFIAPLVALFFARGGAFIGVLVSIVIVFGYYNIWVMTSQIMAKQWILPPVVGAWLPNVLFAIVGLILLWRSE